MGTARHSPPGEERVTCGMCKKEIPKSEATSSEATEYVSYFCGKHCYDLWRRPHETFGELVLTERAREADQHLPPLVVGKLGDHHRLEALGEIAARVGDDLDDTLGGDAHHIGRGRNGRGIATHLFDRLACESEMRHLFIVKHLQFVARGTAFPRTEHVELGQQTLIKSCARALEREALAQLVQQHRGLVAFDGLESGARNAFHRRGRRRRAHRRPRLTVTAYLLKRVLIARRGVSALLRALHHLFAQRGRHARAGAVHPRFTLLLHTALLAIVAAKSKNTHYAAAARLVISVPGDQT